MMNLLRILRHLVIGLAGTAAIAIPLWFVITAFGGKFGAWAPLDAFRHILSFAGLPGFGGGFLLPLALGLGIAALAVSIGFRIAFGRSNAPGAGGFIAGVAAIAVGGVPMAMVVLGQDARSDIPPIHDISTDTANPPEFSAAMVERREIDGATNSVDYASKVDPRSQRPLPEVQAEAYPQVQPIEVAVEPELAYRAALGAAREMGWRVTTASESALMFEGTAETFWFGFKDDVVVRVTETEGGSRIDARSVSRVGVSDLGANAARLEAFSERVRASLGQG
jgi:uncharacterized protein (DUF1499 family)